MDLQVNDGVLSVTRVSFWPKEGASDRIGGGLIVFGDAFKVIFSVFKKDEGGYRVAWPSRKVGDKWYNDAEPVNREAREAIDALVLKKVASELGEDKVRKPVDKDDLW